jgi:hypothetical protein
VLLERTQTFAHTAPDSKTGFDPPSYSAQVKPRGNTASIAVATAVPGGGPEPPSHLAARPLQHADATTGVAFSISPAAGLVGGHSESGVAAPVVVAAVAAVAAASEAASVRVGMLLRAMRALLFAAFSGGASKEVSTIGSVEG